MFSTISHEPSKTQDRTIWQMKHLNLTNMKVFCHFCLKLSEIAQIRHGRRANIYGGPCTQVLGPTRLLNSKEFSHLHAYSDSMLIRHLRVPDIFDLLKDCTNVKILDHNKKVHKRHHLASV